MMDPTAYSSPGDELKTHRAAAIFSVVIVFSITSTVSVALRLLAKRISRSRLAREDYVVIVAQCLLYAMGIAALLEIFLGSAGHHLDAIPPAHIANFLRVLVAMQIFYGTILGLIKTSICLFYIRIFSTRRFRLAAWIVIGFITAWSVTVVLTGFLICQPLAFNWDQTIPGGHCGNETVMFIWIGILDLCTDVAVFALPVPMIWGLKIARGKKMALSGIFGLGLCTMVISIVRIKALVDVSFADVTFTSAYPILWSFMEPAIGITVACGPLMGPLVKNSHFRQTITATQEDASHKSNFQRLEDPEHLLMDLQPNTTSAIPQGVSDIVDRRELISRSDDSSFEGLNVAPPHSMGRISVRREWEIRTT